MDARSADMQCAAQVRGLNVIFRKKLPKVEALQFIPENYDLIRSWCSCITIDENRDHPGIVSSKYLYSAIHGDWIVRNSKGNFKVYSDSDFQEKYYA